MLTCNSVSLRLLRNFLQPDLLSPRFTKKAFIQAERVDPKTHVISYKQSFCSQKRFTSDLCQGAQPNKSAAWASLVHGSCHLPPKDIVLRPSVGEKPLDRTSFASVRPQSYACQTPKESGLRINVVQKDKLARDI